MGRDCATSKCVKEISGETSVHSYILSEGVITFPALTKIKEDDNFSSGPQFIWEMSLSRYINKQRSREKK